MLTFRDITLADRDLVMPMVQAFYHTDAVDHPVDQAILDRSFLAAADHAEPLLRGVLLFQDDQPAGYIYLTQCYSAEVGGRCVFIEEIFLLEPYRGMGLGHQIMALATGAQTEKLKYGHRGANHPVRDVAAGRVFITSQNHGYVVKSDTVSPEVAEISHINVNDGTVEGLRYKNGHVFTVQFHPEAAPGPRDTGYLFDEFVEKMEAKRHA